MGEHFFLEPHPEFLWPSSIQRATKGPFPAWNRSKSGYHQTHSQAKSRICCHDGVWSRQPNLNFFNSHHLEALGKLPQSLQRLSATCSHLILSTQSGSSVFLIYIKHFKIGRSPKYLKILAPLEKPEDMGTLGSRSCRQHHLELWELPHSGHRCLQELSGSPYLPPTLSVIPQSWA